MPIDAPHDVVPAPAPVALLLELLPLLPQPATASAPSAAVAMITRPLMDIASLSHVLHCLGIKSGSSPAAWRGRRPALGTPVGVIHPRSSHRREATRGNSRTPSPAAHSGALLN